MYGTDLKVAREQLGLTREVCAWACGSWMLGQWPTNEAQIKRWESKDGRPPPAIMQTLDIIERDAARHVKLMVDRTMRRMKGFMPGRAFLFRCDNQRDFKRFFPEWASLGLRHHQVVVARIRHQLFLRDVDVAVVEFPGKELRALKAKLKGDGKLHLLGLCLAQRYDGELVNFPYESLGLKRPKPSAKSSGRLLVRANADANDEDADQERQDEVEAYVEGWAKERGLLKR